MATPLVLIPLAKNAKAEFGRITPKSTAYAKYREYVSRATAEDFVRLVTL